MKQSFYYCFFIASLIIYDPYKREFKYLSNKHCWMVTKNNSDKTNWSHSDRLATALNTRLYLCIELKL